MTMIEKVAKAIANQLGHRTAFQIENHKDAARAAIEAMKEPTDEMWNASDSWNDGSPEVWEKMINAALEGK